MPSPDLRLRVNEDGIIESLPGGPVVIISLLPEAWVQNPITPISSIDHTNAGKHRSSWSALFSYLRREDIKTECHVQVTMAGEVAQFMPLTRRADCNAQANSWSQAGRVVGALSHETEDNGSATLAQTPWTPAQFEALAQLHAAECVRFGIPTERCAAWDAPGIGYHSQFPQWSIYQGKTCPGAARIAQMGPLLDRVRALLVDAPPPSLPPPIPPLTPGVEPMFIVRVPGTDPVYVTDGGSYKRHIDGPTYDTYRGWHIFAVPGVVMTGNHEPLGVEQRVLDAIPTVG